MDHLLGEGTWVGLLGSEASLCRERALQSKLAMPFGWRRCWRYMVTEDQAHGRQDLDTNPVPVALTLLETGHLQRALYISLATAERRILVTWTWAAVSEAELVESGIYRGNLTGN